MTDTRDQDIAIVGMACRFPGGGDTPEAFWDLLFNGGDGVGPLPHDRWPRARYEHPDPATPGRSYTGRAGTLDGIAGFDAAFFGISPREAAQMDPQQRLLLEMAWEAMERGGQVPSALAGSDTAVYVGVSATDFGNIRQSDPAAMDRQFMLGSTLSIVANRLSYIFDWHGPSMAIDTACSSSLVALHECVQCLRAGRAKRALVGGVNALLSPFPFVGFATARMLSPEGQCRAFDADGRGYVRAEGGGALVLKPLADARAEGDPVHAVIRGVNVNTDGRTNGIALPSGGSQADLLRRAYAEAGIDPGDVAYFEAHGTGTVAGDAAEADAIGRAIGQRRARENPLPVGSVKSNIGHAEPAAGMAGVMKALGVLRRRAIPPSLHIDRLNPDIPFDDLNLAPARTAQALPETGGAPVVGVNSFGFGGANAHAILAAPDAAPAPASEDTGAPLYITANDADALRARAAALASHLRRADAPAHAATAYTLARRREHLAHRAVVRAAGDQAAACLDALGRGEADKRAVTGSVLPGEAPGVALIFPGNGTQWRGMGVQLFAEDATFAAWVREVDARVAERAGWSVVAELHADREASRLGDTRIDQPLIFAVQVGLYHALTAMGLRPGAVAGHSVGEVAAAYGGGALTLDQAVHVILARSATQAETRGQGRMAAVDIGPERAATEIAPYDGRVDVAAVNAPGSVTLSGPEADLHDLVERLKGEDVTGRLLDLDYPFHNAVLDPVREPLLASLGDLRAATGELPFYSTVAGERLDGTALDAEYWWRNLRRPVRFRDAVAALARDGCRIFVEVGAHPITGGYVRSTLRAEDVEGHVLPTLSRRAAGRARLERAIDGVWCAGGALAWDRLFPRPEPVAELPTYPWQREHHWLPPTPEATGPLFQPRAGRWLGWWALRDAYVWETELDPQLVPALADHAVGGSTVFPAAGFVALATEAAAAVFDAPDAELQLLQLHRPLVFEGGATKVVRTSYDAANRVLRIESRTRMHDEPMQLHATATLTRPAGEAPRAPAVTGDALTPVTAAAHRAATEAVGLQYGPAFQSPTGLRVDGEVALLDLAAPDDTLRPSAGIAPPLLDGCFQALVDVLRARFGADSATAAYLPHQLGRFRVFGTAVPVRAVVAVKRAGQRSVVADISLLDAGGAVVGAAEDARFARAALDTGRQAPPAHVEMDPVPLVPRLTSARPAPIAPAALMPADDPGAPAFDAVAGAFAWAALGSPGAGERGTLDGLVDDLDIPVDRLELLTHTVDLAARAGLLALDAEGGWRRTAEPAPDPEALWREALAAHPDAMAELSVLGRGGKQLAGALRGGPWQDCREHAALWGQLRTSGPAFGPAVAAALDAAERVIRAAGAHRRVRVAVTAAGGAAVLPHLVRRVPADRVAWLAVGPDADALGQTQAALKGTAEIEALAVDPAGGEAAESAYAGAVDLVVAAGVLEAHGAAALDGLAELLTPHGTLVLAEPHTLPWLGLADARTLARWTEGLTGDAASWTAALTERGWREVTGRDVANGAMLAALAPQPPDRARPVPEGTWVVIAAAPERAAWAERALGGPVVRVLTDGTSAGDGTAIHLDPADEAAWQQVWEGLGERPRGVLWLPGDTADGQADESWHAVLLGRTLASAWETPPPVTVAGPSALDADPADEPTVSAIRGVARVLRNEIPELPVRLADVDPADSADALAAELAVSSADADVVVRAGSRHGVRLRPQTLPAFPGSDLGGSDREESDPVAPDPELTFTTGDLERLHWTTGERRAPGAGEVEIAVEASGLNFRDVMFALGALPEEAVEHGFSGPTIGMECAGVVTRVGEGVTSFAPGDGVMAFAPGCFAGHVTTSATAVAHKPDGVPFAAAATIPTVFFTVYYSLAHLAALEPGERVLIHGAAGGVGQAAIQYARHARAEIFATAGTPEKREVVELLGVPPANIFDSRSLSFAEGVRAATGGEGVDVVLNSLAGEAVEANLGLLRPFGRFIELGKRDFFEGSRIGLRPFRNNISYFGVDADQLMAAKPRLAQRLFGEVRELFTRGVFAPLPYRAYAAGDVVTAFRDMQQARHLGKLVIRAPAPADPAAARPVTGVSPDPAGRYLVTGGVRGFGWASARWLAAKGARDLVLVSRRGADDDATQAALQTLRDEGVRVETHACDVADPQAVAELVAAIDTLDRPLKGVIHAAAVFDDAPVQTMTAGQMQRVMAAKAAGAWALHRATAGKALDLFVLYSSVTTLFGNPGQANYVAANAFLEWLAAHRRERAETALAVRWGPIADSGYLARNAELGDQLEATLGGAPLSTGEALAELDRLLAAGVTRMTVARVDWRKLADRLPGMRAAAFREVAGQRGTDDGGAALDLPTLVTQLDAGEVRGLLADTLREELGNVLRLPSDKIDMDVSIFELGMDSLMAVELRTALEQRLGITVPAMALREGVTIRSLSESLYERLAGADTVAGGG